MVRITLALLITTALCLTFGSVAEPVMAKQLKPGMPNTITLPNGEVIYDLNGEWEAVYDIAARHGWAGGTEQRESSKDIVGITQEGNQFVGVKLIGDEWVGKNQEAVKGELEKNGLRKVHAFVYDPRTPGGPQWFPSKGKITEDGNKIVITARPSNRTTMTIVLKRK